MEGLAGLRLLLAGDDPVAVAELRSVLAGGGAVAVACSADPREVAALVVDDPPAAVLAVEPSDPEALRARLDPLGLGGGPEVIPVAVLVAADEPFGPAAARRLRALVDRRNLRARQSELESVVAAQAVARRRELEAASLDALRRLAMAAEYRDDNTHEHPQRVADLAARLARHLGADDHEVALLRAAAPLHDLGKVAIPDRVLLKPGKLSTEEFEVVKTHAVLGARVLAGSASEVVQTAERVARSHHERWDGSGYPDGLAGEGIPLVGRLVHVADVYDVLVHERPYKESWTVEAAAEEIERGAGTQFDPAIVRAFGELRAEPAEKVRDPAP